MRAGLLPDGAQLPGLEFGQMNARALVACEANSNGGCEGIAVGRATVVFSA